MLNFFKRYIGDKQFYRELFIVAMPIALHQLLSSLINFFRFGDDWPVGVVLTSEAVKY